MKPNPPQGGGEIEWWYLVNFNILFKNINGVKTPDALIYSYYKYSSLFISTLVNYLEECTLQDCTLMNVNAKIFIIDSLLTKYRGCIDETIQYQNMNYLYADNMQKTNLNLVEVLLAMSVNGPIYLDIDGMSKIIYYLSHGYWNTIVDLYKQYFIQQANFKNFYGKTKFKIRYKKKYNKNILFNFVFLVKNLDDLIKLLNYTKVNGGPQKHRAHCNLLDFNLTRIDIGFRNSMYIYFYKLGAPIVKKDFSFNNVHMNLGGVRYISTNTRNPFHRCMQTSRLRRREMVLRKTLIS